MDTQRHQPSLPITGYSLLNGMGASRADIAAGLLNMRTGLGPSPFDVPFPCAVGAVHTPLAPLEGALADWDTRVARMAAHLVAALGPALTAAQARWRPERIAVLLGTSTAGALHTEQAYRHFVETGALPDGYDFRRQHTYGAVLHVVGELASAMGPRWMVSTACTSSAKPLASAKRLIHSGVVDAAIVGGIDTLCGMTLRGFKSLDALSAGACRPFSADRDGISIGEGGALLLVEREGDPVAWLEAVGESSDAYHMNAPHPQGAGAELAMRRALAEARCEADAIDHINGHGTGTRLNDLAESKAVVRVFGREVPLVSTKAFTGHTLGAAGATEAALSIMALQDGVIPGQLGFGGADPKIEAHVPQAPRFGAIRRVMSNCFAFGGSNVSVILRAA